MKDLTTYLTQHLGLGKLEVALAESVFARYPKMNALGTYSGGNLPHGQTSAHERWVKELKLLQQGFVDMEIRAAKMKVELAQYLDKLSKADSNPDWENPTIRKKIKKEISIFYNKARGIIESKSNKDRLPKLTDEMFHNMLVFNQGKIHELNIKRLSCEKAKSQLMTKLISIKKDELGEYNSNLINNKLYIDMYVIPKHIDGNKDYATVRHVNTKFRRDNINVQENWIKTNSGWKIDPGQFYLRTS